MADSVPSEATSMKSEEELNIEKIKRELGALQDYLMSAPEDQKKMLMSQIKGVKKSLQSAVTNFKNPMADIDRESGTDEALVAQLRAVSDKQKHDMLKQNQQHEMEISKLTSDLHDQMEQRQLVVTQLTEQ